MKPTQDIKKELQELGIRIPEGLKTPFMPEEGYFSGFESNILDQVKSLDFLQTLPKNTPFSITPNYFNTLSESIENQLFIEKLPKSNPFLAPEGYFEKNLEELRSITTPTLVPHLSIHKSLKYSMSIAAALLAFISLSFYIINRPSHVDVESGLASLNSSEIESYIANHAAEFDLAQNTETLDYNEVDIKNLEKNLIEKQLEDLSEKELTDFIL